METKSILEYCNDNAAECLQPHNLIYSWCNTKSNRNAIRKYIYCVHLLSPWWYLLWCLFHWRISSIWHSQCSTYKYCFRHLSIKWRCPVIHCLLQWSIKASSWYITDPRTQGSNPKHKNPCTHISVYLDGFTIPSSVNT
jgi:hypothetical protein